MEGDAFQTQGHYFWRDFGKSHQKYYRDFRRDWEIKLEPSYDPHSTQSRMTPDERQQ
jgi:hypothetical protein